MDYSNGVREGFVNLTSSEKLLFIASFIWFMNWGVRVFSSTFNYVFF